MRYSLATTAALLAVLPLALAAKKNSIKANQTSKFEGAHNLTGIVGSSIEGRINAFNHDKFTTFTALSWTEDNVNGESASLWRVDSVSACSSS